MEFNSFVIKNNSIIFTIKFLWIYFYSILYISSFGVLKYYSQNDSRQILISDSVFFQIFVI